MCSLPVMAEVSQNKLEIKATEMCFSPSPEFMGSQARCWQGCTRPRLFRLLVAADMAYRPPPPVCVPHSHLAFL